MKKYKIKPPSKKILKKYWDALKKQEDYFYDRVRVIEKAMEEETGIKDIEFFWCDNSIVGIGNAYRTMKLIDRTDY